jgi:integrase
VADGLIPRNVTQGVKAPRPAKKEIRPLSPEQTQVFLRASCGDRFEALYVLAIHCGLREGELLGLKWDDINLEARTLQVRRTLSETRNGPIFEPPKKRYQNSREGSQQPSSCLSREPNTIFSNFSLFTASTKRLLRLQSRLLS